MGHYKDISPTCIYVESSSYDTISNFFARTSHTDMGNWGKILFVTNDFHMGRTKAIFDWIFKMNIDKENPYGIHYLPCPNEGIITLEAIKARNYPEKKTACKPRKKSHP